MQWRSLRSLLPYICKRKVLLDTVSQITNRGLRCPMAPYEYISYLLLPRNSSHITQNLDYLSWKRIFYHCCYWFLITESQLQFFITKSKQQVSYYCILVADVFQLYLSYKFVFFYSIFFTDFLSIYILSWHISCKCILGAGFLSLCLVTEFFQLYLNYSNYLAISVQFICFSLVY